MLIKLTQLETRLQRVERVLDNQSLVSLANELQQLRAEMSELRNQLETLQFEAENARKRQRDLYVDIDTRLNSLEGNVSAAPVATDTVLEGDSGAVPGAEAVLDDRDAYKQAFGLLEQGQYAEASAAFREFVGRYPDSALLDNAQYWLAESLYVERAFEQALAEFEKVVELYPQSRKIPDAWLKIGYTLYELQRYSEARAALERVIAEHAGSTAARLAGQRLERMNREGR